MITALIAAVTFTASVLVTAHLWTLATQASLDGRKIQKWLYLTASIICVFGGGMIMTLIARG